MLGALGEARVHLHSFPTFLGVLLGLCLLTVGVFVATATGAPPDRAGAQQD